MTEVVNGTISAFRVFFGGRHPDDWLHIQFGSGLAVMFGALFLWVRLKEKAGDDAKAD